MKNIVDFNFNLVTYLILSIVGRKACHYIVPIFKELFCET